MEQVALSFWASRTSGIPATGAKMLLACVHFEDVVDKDNNNYKLRT